ncbi:PREDICTED: uncharacterized protein LOC104588104 [Nelumbo nucifera]|uniref:Uncharacterized protein LOC104588104 n=1 Tax=Nelumbo nucifera TaxID=4432 RepID=A0A1U7Z0X3_NELNU|nr:PREDICTED: uncharacterized protein LOC104588104 [Nelumbo nucifera]
MADEANRTLLDYACPTIDGATSSISKPTIQANNFEIKPAIVQIIQTSIQFSGLLSDDPNAHIVNFLEICDTFKHNGVSDDAIRLRLFPFSFRDRVKDWLNSLSAETAGGTIMGKTPEEAYDLVDEMVSNSYQWNNDRVDRRGVHHIDSFAALSAHFASLNKKLDNLSVATINVSSCNPCYLCGQLGHINSDC